MQGGMYGAAAGWMEQSVWKGGTGGRVRQGDQGNSRVNGVRQGDRGGEDRTGGLDEY